MRCCLPKKRFYTIRLLSSPYTPPPFLIPYRYRIRGAEFPCDFEEAYHHDIIGNLWLKQILHRMIADYLSHHTIHQRTVVLETEEYIGQFLITENMASGETLVLRMNPW
jgi:hypothetical protein